MSVYVAVYGILRSDIHAERFSGDYPPIMSEYADLVGPCRIPGELLSVGAFPGLVEGEGSVVGQVWKVRRRQVQAAFRELDGIEGYRRDDEASSMYLRRKVRLIQPRRIRAYCYIWNGTRDLPVVESGDWRQHEQIFHTEVLQLSRFSFSEFGAACPECGRPVAVGYEHERENPPLCGDCWEFLTAER